MGALRGLRQLYPRAVCYRSPNASVEANRIESILVPSQRERHSGRVKGAERVRDGIGNIRTDVFRERQLPPRQPEQFEATVGILRHGDLLPPYWSKLGCAPPAAAWRSLR